MEAIMKAAVITWLLDRKIKVVHIWDCGDHWKAMVETCFVRPSERDRTCSWSQ